MNIHYIQNILYISCIYSFYIRFCYAFCIGLSIGWHMGDYLTFSHLHRLFVTYSRGFECHCSVIKSHGMKVVIAFSVDLCYDIWYIIK